MIEEIQINDLGVIQETKLSFSKGLTVLTGETGAGKTMVLTALGLLLGNRADSSTVRSGSAATSVSGNFLIPANHPAQINAEDAGALIEDGELVLSRTVSADGKSKAYAGGRPVPAGILNEIGSSLVVIHGQSDQIRLKATSAQREALDKFAGVAHLELLASYREVFGRWREVLGLLSEARSGSLNLERERAELLDNLDFLEKLDPKANEDVELQELAQKLTHAEQLQTAVLLAHDSLIGSEYDSLDALSLVAKARKALESAANYDSGLGDKVELLRLLGGQLNDVAAELSSYLSSIDGTDGLSLDEIQERRSLLATAIRRFGPSLDEVISYRQNAQERLLSLDNSGGSIDALEKSAQTLESQVVVLAKELSDSRLKAAKDLSDRVTQVLATLAMPNSKLQVQLVGTEPTSSGIDEVTFMLQSYEGAEPRPIAKSASGGELSRIMLALEVILAEGESATTFIFDEVDAGVGGAAAIEVGRALAGLAKKSQVIVVTHLAQVAAFADRHLTVVKSSSAGFTSSDVKDLSSAERATELARMLSGLQDSESARTHALELLDLAGQAS